jgi:hypothetical protein
VPRSSHWSLPFRFSSQNTVCISHLSHACSMLRQSLPFWKTTLIVFGEACKLWSSSLCSLLQPPVTSKLLGPDRCFVLCSKRGCKKQMTVFGRMAKLQVRWVEFPAASVFSASCI